MNQDEGSVEVRKGKEKKLKKLFKGMWATFSGLPLHLS